jgi:B3 DNA binding domain
MPDKTFVRTEISLLDSRGRLWPVQYECILRGGQRHSRLKHGWAKLCHANNFSVGDRIKFQSIGLIDKATVIRVDKVVTGM